MLVVRLISEHGIERIIFRSLGSLSCCSCSCLRLQVKRAYVSVAEGVSARRSGSIHHNTQKTTEGKGPPHLLSSEVSALKYLQISFCERNLLRENLLHGQVVYSIPLVVGTMEHMANCTHETGEQICSSRDPWQATERLMHTILPTIWWP